MSRILYRKLKGINFIIQLNNKKLDKKEMHKMKYHIVDKETHNVIDYAYSVKDAKAIIKAFEEEDKKEGNYTEDYYEIIRTGEGVQTMTKREYEKVKVLLDNFNCEWKELNKYEYRVNYTNLFDAYASFSWAKQQAFNYCQNLSNWLDGYGDNIPSKNSMLFTYAFRFELFDVEMYAYITKGYNRIGFYGMDRYEGIEELAKNWKLYFQDYDASSEGIYNFQTLLSEMLGSKNKHLKEELHENGIL